MGLSARARRGRYRWGWQGGHVRRDGTLRRWHPGFWRAVVLGTLRHWGLLPHLCRTCGGAGRLLTRRYLRRMACPACQGTGTAEKGLMETLTAIVTRRRGSTAQPGAQRASVRASIAASPAGNHERYPAGSIVVCVSCAAPIYRLERGIGIGERAGRSADAYKPVRLIDLQQLLAREDVEPGIRAVLAGKTALELKAHCERIPDLRAGDPLACPACGRAFVAARSTEASETRDRGYVIELLTIPPLGQPGTRLKGGAVHARRLAGIQR